MKTKTKRELGKLMLAFMTLLYLTACACMIGWSNTLILVVSISVVVGLVCLTGWLLWS